mgnify:CR=1 FL=1
MPLSRLVEQLHAKLQQHSAAPPPSANGAGALVTGGAAAAAVATPLLQGGPSVVQGADDPSGMIALAQWSDRNEQASVDEVEEIINDEDWGVMGSEGAALRAILLETMVVPLASYVETQSSRERPSSSDSDDTAQPPTSRQRTEPPAPTMRSLGASAEADHAPPAATYRGLGASEDTPQYQSASASDADHAPPAFRSLGGDNQVTSPAFRSLGSSPCTVGVAVDEELDEPPPAFCSLGADEELDEPVFRSAATGEEDEEVYPNPNP